MTIFRKPLLPHSFHLKQNVDYQFNLSKFLCQISLMYLYIYCAFILPQRLIVFGQKFVQERLNQKFEIERFRYLDLLHIVQDQGNVIVVNEITFFITSSCFLFFPYSLQYFIISSKQIFPFVSCQFYLPRICCKEINCRFRFDSDASLNFKGNSPSERSFGF